MCFLNTNVLDMIVSNTDLHTDNVDVDYDQLQFLTSVWCDMGF